MNCYQCGAELVDDPIGYSPPSLWCPNCREIRDENNPSGVKIDGVQIRPEILEFVKAMELKMREKDAAKGDSWKRCAVDYLKLGLQSEYGEAINAKDPKEYVDLGNYCWMIYNRLKYNPTEGGKIYGRG